jgi:hypothetical protein
MKVFNTYNHQSGADSEQQYHKCTDQHHRPGRQRWRAGVTCVKRLMDNGRYARRHSADTALGQRTVRLVRQVNALHQQTNKESNVSICLVLVEPGKCIGHVCFHSRVRRRIYGAERVQVVHRGSRHCGPAGRRGRLMGAHVVHARVKQRLEAVWISATGTG